jgi:hypothetical protein
MGVGERGGEYDEFLEEMAVGIFWGNGFFQRTLQLLGGSRQQCGVKFKCPEYI